MDRQTDGKRFLEALIRRGITVLGTMIQRVRLQTQITAKLNHSNKLLYFMRPINPQPRIHVAE